MKYIIRNPILLICCSLVPGVLALRPRRPLVLGTKVAQPQPHHLPAESFDVNVKCNPGVGGFMADKLFAFAGTNIKSSSAKMLGIRGGASAVGVVTSPAFWLMAAMITLRVMGESVPYSKLIEGVLTVALIGYFFLLLTRWQESVQAGNAD